MKTNQKSVLHCDVLNFIHKSKCLPSSTRRIAFLHPYIKMLPSFTNQNASFTNQNASFIHKSRCFPSTYQIAFLRTQIEDNKHARIQAKNQFSSRFSALTLLAVKLRMLCKRINRQHSIEIFRFLKVCETKSIGKRGLK